MDTPGFSSLYVEDIRKEELKDYIPEFYPYEGSCRFLPCTHTHEPDCRKLPEGQWIMNPGSAGNYGGTAGIILLDGKDIVCRIIRQSDLEGMQ